MPTSALLQKRVFALKREYDRLKKGKQSLLAILDEVEIPESVYNSNAIENSTLTLKETEKILLEMEVSRDVSVREVYEAKNLARVASYVRNKAPDKELDRDTILLLHAMLIGGIDDDIAGRFRKKGEYVRVGMHIAPAPEQVEHMIEDTLQAFAGDLEPFFVDRIAKFHLDFERIHPFNDGNGRIGRVIIAYQLQRFRFPTIIIRNKEKHEYYKAFVEYNATKNTKNMEKIMLLSLMESLHKRIAYLQGDSIIALAEYSKKHGKTASSLLNAARHQTIPAFRERGVWNIGAPTP